MGTVRFTDPKEFIEEVMADKASVDRNVVRLTGLYRPTKFAPSVTDYSVVATARVGQDVLRLERYCGQLWNLDRALDEKVQKVAEEVKEFIELACKGVGLEVRTGMLGEEA